MKVEAIIAVIAALVVLGATLATYSENKYDKDMQKRHAAEVSELEEGTRELVCVRTKHLAERVALARHRGTTYIEVQAAVVGSPTGERLAKEAYDEPRKFVFYTLSVRRFYLQQYVDCMKAVKKVRMT